MYQVAPIASSVPFGIRFPGSRSATRQGRHQL